MATIDEGRVVTDPLAGDWYHNKVAAVDILRLDLTHPVVSGNKWYKLRYNLQHAVSEGYRSVLTFGGAHSNHLVATAAAAADAGLSSVGVVRGHHAATSLTPALQECRQYGMRLHFVSRTDYERIQEPGMQQALSNEFGKPYFIPEGGANQDGVAGAATIANLIPEVYTHVCVSVGSGTTLAGLRQGLPASCHLVGFAPMKGGSYLQEDITRWLSPDKNQNWQLTDEWHFGGFGKCNEKLVAFMNDFYLRHQVPLDRVYTAKMMYGLQQMILSGSFPTEARILAVHTGGLQGNRSLADALVF